LRIRFSFLLLYFFWFFSAAAQPDSCHLRISLLTCSPGEELYSTFGHTALRVTDSTTGSDLVFNYGTFEFGPDFYTQFVLGKLLYSLSIERFDDFMYNYQLESRSVQEQELLLDCISAQKLYGALMMNAQPQNRHYRYDFLFDNCTTRARDIVARNAPSPVIFNTILPSPPPTFRDQIHTYLDLGGQYWSRLGIDILLGIKLDQRVTNLQSMFLPDYLLKGFDHATTNHHPLASPPKTILQMPSPLNKGSLFRPGIVFTILLVVGVALSFSKARWAVNAISFFDFLFFFVLGLSGLLILFMWFGTNHTVCRDNLNILWALPTHFIIAFVLHKNKKWIHVYFKTVLVISGMLVLTWPWFPQELNVALLPIVLLIIVRSWFLSKWNIYAGAKRTYTK